MEEVFVHLKTKEKEIEQELEFSMSNVTELQKVIIIQNMFEKMGVKNDLTRMVEDYVKIGKAYESFHNEVDNIESEPIKEIQQQVHDGKSFEQTGYSKTILAKHYNEALKTDKEVSTEVEESTEPEHYKTGILKEIGKPNKYQCRYHCECGTQKTTYVPKEANKITCSGCGKQHTVRWAKRGYLEKDTWNNFFIAGKFVGEEELKK